METIKIEKMTLADFEQIKDTLISDFDAFWPPSILQAELMEKSRVYVAAKKEEEVVGFAGTMLNLPDMEIMNIVVKKKERQKGIGKWLLNKIIETAENNYVEKIFLEVNGANLAAIKMYEKAGFKQIGKRENYYGEETQAYLMSKKVNNLHKKY